MLFNNNSISISFSVNQFQCKYMNVDVWNEVDSENKIIIEYESTCATDAVRCPYCGKAVQGHGTATTALKDMPIWFGIEQEAVVTYHRYQCTECRRVFSEYIDFKHPGVRITERAVNWIKSFLRLGLSVKSISEITGIHWNTIRHLHEEAIKEKLDEREKFLKALGYKPRLLAIDEFAIHKGHTYATTVMDLETGDVLWVGKGRTIEDFQHFFEDVDPERLSDVEAVAMDMNASYNKVVRENLPDAQIVYDRYHMQAQYGKDVLGVVRLNEARQHKEEANRIIREDVPAADRKEKASLKQEARAERQLYSKLKKSRWILLRNSDNLSDNAQLYLEEILLSHEDLATCYAMKEEMCELFEITDPAAARERWEKWFSAALESCIEPLMKFARLKKDRIEGLVAHATYPISTGKLEGLNNKIKVAKRLGYGFRNDAYFFSLIRFLSIPPL